MELPESGAKRTGAMLSAGRIAAGLELVDVARETRVPLRHLKALEADRHDELPALPYAIGFVKAYARAIGLDPESVAAQFRGETSKSAHVPTPVTLEPLDERRLPSRGLVFGSLAAIVLIIAGLSAWGAGVFDPPAATETAG
ncbi:MAG: helix-turn-helix domain-containing protein [Polymorphobacter sp.]